MLLQFMEVLHHLLERCVFMINNLFCSSFFFSFKGQSSIDTIKIKINLNYYLFNSNFQNATLALVPPQQQVHTTGAMAGEVMSTTSSGI